MEEEIASTSVVNFHEEPFGAGSMVCGCRRPPRLMMSRTPRNPDRKFWGCSHEGSHCNFFKWHDEWVNERTLLVMTELRRLNSTLERFEEQINVELENEISGLKNLNLAMKNEKSKLKFENCKLKSQMAIMNLNLKKTNEGLNGMKKTTDEAIAAMKNSREM